jgi:hypothetical protein
MRRLRDDFSGDELQGKLARRKNFAHTHTAQAASSVE